MRRALLIALTALAAFAPPAPAAQRLHQMVVFRDGHARFAQPPMTQATAHVRGRTCAVAGATPLAALIHSGIGPLSLKDYGSCSKRPADGGGLFVSGIGSDRNRGSDGWVYKAGNVLGTAGAADPAGPLGRGRVRLGTRITWFWCHVTARAGGCPHTLGINARVVGRTIIVTVRHYNDSGNGRPAKGASVHVGSLKLVTDSGGGARINAHRGSYVLWASQPGRVRSFPISVSVS